ncbi:TetR/AcrR family transcriptional regulator [Halomicrobium salinisoli]|uniref:TetR/AcrR family transcriptional regulator n=1 Tax=Halomicrobium salinisoli TaxID=2878391 RepID=UPI001CF0AF9B|nr:TetR/AcrR family transcriptional regulator [Halomicrobium salinisoli]
MSEPSEDIMEATFRALCEHGYAALTMRDIAAEADRSKASLHYHYESKQGLMLAFLDHLFEHFTDRVGSFDPAGDPDAQLRAFVDEILHPPGEDTTREFRTALLEIKAQAPYDEAFRERLTAFDEHIRENVRAAVAAGVDRGVYRDDADPDAVARFVLTLADGAQSRHVVAGADPDDAMAVFESYVESRLLADREVSA